MVNVEPGEGCTSSGAVDESDGSRGRGGEEREGKGDLAHDAYDDDVDAHDDDLDDDDDGSRGRGGEERESKGELDDDDAPMLLCSYDNADARAKVNLVMILILKMILLLMIILMMILAIVLMMTMMVWMNICNDANAR